MNCLHPIWLTKLSKVRFPDGLVVPCGKCINCRMQRSREWSLRLEHELIYTKLSYFVTLTYDDEHCPKCMSLRKHQLKRYFKQLRKYTNSKFKYYACGEYGDSENYTGRPHYHAILYIYDDKYDDKEWTGYVDEKKIPHDGVLQTVWDKGRVSADTVTAKSISYVTGYVDKKILDYKKIPIGNKSEPFKLISKNIGMKYCIDNYDYLTKNLSVNVMGKDIALPRYYKKILQINPEKIKESANSEKLMKLKKYMKKKRIKTMNYADYTKLFYKSEKQKAKNIEAKYKMKHTSRNKIC